MPVVKCPSCRTCLRYQQSRPANTLLTLCCPVCNSRMKVRHRSFFGPKVLIAHTDQQISQQLFERLAILGLSVQSCDSEADAARKLEQESGCLLLLDVAFEGKFPFSLVKQAKERHLEKQHRVVLLPSVYNKTAYKKKPTSLYGADAYLELHHIGDRLLSIIAELYPACKPVDELAAAAHTIATERDIVGKSLFDQASRLAELLVADIVFYHKQELHAGLHTGQATALLSGPLAEGRELLRQRLPESGSIKVDFVGQAFLKLCHQYFATQTQTAYQAR